MTMTTAALLDRGQDKSVARPGPDGPWLLASQRSRSGKADVVESEVGLAVLQPVR